MANVLNILRTVLTLLPLLIDAVRAIEAAMPQSGLGAAKLGVIRSTLEAAFSVAKDASVTFDQVWPVLETAVGAVVGVFNKVGIFNKAA